MHATKKCLVRPTIHVVQYPSESSESKCCAEEEEVAEEMLFKTTGIDIAQKKIEREMVDRRLRDIPLALHFLLHSPDYISVENLLFAFYNT